MKNLRNQAKHFFLLEFSFNSFNALDESARPIFVDSYRRKRAFVYFVFFVVYDRWRSCATFECIWVSGIIMATTGIPVTKKKEITLSSAYWL